MRNLINRQKNVFRANNQKLVEFKEKNFSKNWVKIEVFLNEANFRLIENKSVGFSQV